MVNNSVYFWGVWQCIIQVCMIKIRTLIVLSILMRYCMLTSSLSSTLNSLLWSAPYAIIGTHNPMHGIQVRPGYFISLVRPTWPWQNITQMTQHGFNPVAYLLYIKFLVGFLTWVKADLLYWEEKSYVTWMLSASRISKIFYHSSVP